MELEFQCELGIISDLKNAHRREVRTRTSLLYVQKKYNLFREESEGFSMLIGDVSLYLEKLKESSATGSDKGNGMQKAAREMLHRVLSLSGYYSIDPNRVLDVILDLFALNIADHWQFFLYFLEISPWINTVNSSDDAGKKCALINEVLGTKFTGHDPKSIPKKIHQGVYVMAALLVKHKLVDLDYLYSRLSPPDSEFESLAAGYRDDIKNKESSSGRFQSQSVCISCWILLSLALT